MLNISHFDEDISKKERLYANKIMQLRDTIFDFMQSNVRPIEYLTASDIQLHNKLCISLSQINELAMQIFKLNPKRKKNKQKLFEIFNGDEDPTSLKYKYKFSDEIKSWVASKLVEYKNLKDIHLPTVLCYTISSIPSVRNDVVLSIIHKEIHKAYRMGKVKKSEIVQNIQRAFDLDIGFSNDRNIWEEKLSKQFNNIYLALNYTTID